MILLLDTSVIIDLNSRNKNTVERLSSLKTSYPDIPKISFITYVEFLYGLRKKQPHNRQKSLAFLEQFEVVQTTKQTAVVLSALKEKYGQIPISDLFIAAQAIEHNMMLVTTDRDFAAIQELNKIIL